MSLLIPSHIAIAALLNAAGIAPIPETEHKNHAPVSIFAEAATATGLSHAWNEPYIPHWIEGAGVFTIDESGPYKESDWLAGVCMIRTIYDDGISGSGLYLGNGKVLTADHSAIFEGSVLAGYVQFAKDDTGMWLQPGFSNGNGGCSNSHLRRVDVDSVVRGDPTRYIGDNHTCGGACHPDAALLTLDISTDSLANIPDPILSTQRLPIRHIMSTLEQNYLASPALDEYNESEVLLSGWGVGTPPPGITCAHYFRYANSKITTADNDTYVISGNANGGMQDSGSPIWIINQSGELVSVGLFRLSLGGELHHEYRRRLDFDIMAHTDAVDGRDLTGESGSGGQYLTPLDNMSDFSADGAVDFHDAVFAYTMIEDGDLRANFDGLMSPLTITVSSDWPAYVSLLGDNHLNIYSSRNYLPLHPDTLDWNSDGRMNSADADGLLAAYAASEIGHEFDFNRDSTVDADDRDILATVIASLGHGLFCDIDGDDDVDSNDLSALLTLSDPFRNRIAGSADYKIALDHDIDGDNDLADSLAARNVLMPLDMGDPVFLSPGDYLNHNIFDFVISSDDFAGYIASVGFASAPADLRYLHEHGDFTGSRNPSSSEYGVPDGEVTIVDLWWYAQEYASATSTSITFPAIFDANGDGRTNFADAVWYEDHEGSTDPADLVWDTNGDGALTSHDTDNIGRLLYTPWESLGFQDCIDLPQGGARILQSYNQGLLGDFDEDPPLQSACDTLPISSCRASIIDVSYEYDLVNYSVNFPIADADNSGSLSPADYSAFAILIQNQDPAADLNNDNKINSLDGAIFDDIFVMVHPVSVAISCDDGEYQYEWHENVAYSYASKTAPVVNSDDLDALSAALASGDFSFGGQRFGQPSFRWTMDCDLDGDNDSTDQVCVFNIYQRGDVNGDGLVNTKDFNTWQALFVQKSPLADSNGDGVFDAPTDFRAWLNCYISSQR